MGLTRSNIAYDLTISPHSMVVIYEGYEVRYVFSSDLYKRKFKESIKNHRDKINQSLTKRFGFEICFDILADLKLYTTIEKRGFLVYKDGTRIECQNNITLDGNNLIMTI